jgi:hypothetical protein
VTSHFRTRLAEKKTLGDGQCPWIIIYDSGEWLSVDLGGTLIMKPLRWHLHSHTHSLSLSLSLSLISLTSLSFSLYLSLLSPSLFSLTLSLSSFLFSYFSLSLFLPHCSLPIFVIFSPLSPLASESCYYLKWQQSSIIVKWYYGHFKNYTSNQ